MAVGAPSPDRVSDAERTAGIRIATNQEAPKVLDGIVGNQRNVIDATRQFAQDQDAENGLDALVTQFAYGATFERTAKDRIYTGTNPTTGERAARPVRRDGRTEVEDLREVTQMTNLYREYLRGGIDGLQDGNGLSRAQKMDMLFNQVRTFLENDDIFGAALAEANGTFSLNTLSQILRNTKVQDALAARLNALYDPTVQSEADGELLSEENKMNDSRAERDRLAPLDIAAKARVDAQEAKNKSFKEDNYPTSSTTGKTKQEAYDLLSVDNDVVTYQKSLKALRDAVSRKDSTAISYYEPIVKGLEGSAKIIEHQELSSERTALDSSLRDARTEYQNTHTEYTTQKNAFLEAKRRSDELRTQRDAESVDFANSIRTALTDVVREQSKADAKAYIAKIPTYRAEVEGELQQRVDQAIQDHLDGRWTTVITRRVNRNRLGNISDRFREDQQISIYNIDQTQQDIDAIIAGGPDAYIRTVLTAAGVQPTEIDRLMNDTEFVRVQRINLVAKTMTAYTNSERPDGKDVDKGQRDRTLESMESILRTSRWGREVSAAMIKNNPAAAQEAQKITKRAVDGQTVEDIHKKLGKKGVLQILLMALGSTVMLVQDAAELGAAA